MKCSYHPTVDSANGCSICGRMLCEPCSHQIRGKIYCQDCLIRGTEWAAAALNLSHPKYAPQRAALFALIPGMGAVYNGQYMKAITQFALFLSLAILGEEVYGIFKLAAFSFYIYMIFDAYRSAEEIQRMRLSEGSPSAPSASDLSSPLWGVLLICIGVLFTLNNLNIISLYELKKFWPLTLVAVGLLLIFRSITGRKGGS